MLRGSFFTRIFNTKRGRVERNLASEMQDYDRWFEGWGWENGERKGINSEQVHHNSKGF